MNNLDRFEQTSYDAHQRWLEKTYPDEKTRNQLLKNWKADGSVNYWRYERLHNVEKPFLTPESTWLTVGDGIGKDANYLLKFTQHVVASDISETLLSVAQKYGVVKDYAIQNAEKLTFADNSFDYVLCRESFHHFPRPYIALYEMIRVAKKAVIMVEPIDILGTMPAILWLKNILDLFNPQWINKIWKNRFSFETVGNYVYKISEREIEKVAMGINLPALAFYKLNDYEKHSPDFEKDPAPAKAFNKIKRALFWRNLLSSIGIIPHSILCPVIFKQLPDKETLTKMMEMKFKYCELPKNPYL